MNSLIDFLINYYTEAKIESILFILIGSISISLTLIFQLIIKYSFFKGIAIPFLFGGVIQIIFGSIIYFQTTKAIIKLENQIKNKTTYIQYSEISHIETVLQNYINYKWIEYILIIAGIILMTAFHKSSQTFWKGLGLGLIIQVGLILCLNMVAKNRIETYLQHLSTYETIK